MNQVVRTHLQLYLLIPILFANCRTTFGLIIYVLFWSLPNLATVWFFLAATDEVNIYALLYGICFVLILWNVDSYFTTTSEKPKRL